MRGSSFVRRTSGTFRLVYVRYDIAPVRSERARLQERERESKKEKERERESLFLGKTIR